MFGAETALLLRQLVAHRVSLLVTGGTGTGKTTLLGGLLAEVPHDERIVLVEDVRELAVAHPHIVRLQGRSANVEGRGAVTLVDLVRQALRMRPDRLVVGEVRGAEVRELLAALNTGHEGGCGTVHANSPSDVVARFEALGALAGLSRDAVQAQLASAVQAVVHVRRDHRGRAVESLSVLAPSGSGLGVERAVTCATGERGSGWPQLAPPARGGPVTTHLAHPSLLGFAALAALSVLVWPARRSRRHLRPTGPHGPSGSLGPRSRWVVGGGTHRGGVTGSGSRSHSTTWQTWSMCSSRRCRPGWPPRRPCARPPEPWAIDQP